jgi:hypothetical protein
MLYLVDAGELTEAGLAGKRESVGANDGIGQPTRVREMSYLDSHFEN